jgi:hypothetical protein
MLTGTRLWVTRVSRGPDCPLGPLGKCGPVLRAPGPRGSRNQPTQAMYDDNSRGLESPDRPAESLVSDQRRAADRLEVAR